jgi:hypothetical protein
MTTHTTEVLSTHHVGTVRRDLVLEQHGREWRLFWATNGRCQDARRVRRFRSESLARTAAGEMLTQES